MDHYYIIREERRAYRATREEHIKYCLTPPVKVDTVILADPKAYHNMSHVSTRQYYQQPHANNFGHRGPNNKYLPQHNRAYPQTISPPGTYLQTLDHQVAPVKKYVVAPPIMDCNEAAELYHGIVIKEYGRNNKFHDHFRA